MNPFITTVNLERVSGLPMNIFKSPLTLKKGLNLISGENGTGKTMVLSHIKRNIHDVNIITFEGVRSVRVLIFNPKRNSEKRSMQQIALNLRQQGITDRKQIEAAIGQQMDDQSVIPYASFGELFHTQVQAKIGTGTVTGHDAVAQVSFEFNKILSQVFPKYQITASWEASSDQPSPVLNFIKNGITGINHESLSCGEREVFSLIFNIFTSKDGVDIYLVDEPEIHLNWSLENNLFVFLKWFSETYDKQVIVVTHSRAIFLDSFVKETKFFVWNDEKIEIQDFISEDIKKAIGGDSINIIRSLEMNEKTFFVEDGISNLIIKTLASVIGKNIGATQAGNCSTVKALCRVAKEQGIINCLFLIDNDNEGMPSEFKGEPSFIMLNKYCIENYLLDFEILGKISNPVKTEEEVKLIVNNLINADNSKKNKAFQSMARTGVLMDNTSVLDTFDASYIFDEAKGGLACQIGLSSRDDLVDKFIKQSFVDGKLETIFSEITTKF